MSVISLSQWNGRFRPVILFLDRILPKGSSVVFAIQTVLACGLALYTAFALQLEAPVWAGMTAWIVANPNPGMVASKAMYRGAGTILGAIVSIILLALFAQSPLLLFIALAVWISICTLVSYLLQNFRAYAAVLSGYTAAIIIMDSAATPGQVFFTAMARATCILLGVASTALLSALFARRTAPEKMITQFRAAKRHIFEYAQTTLRNKSSPQISTNEKRLISELLDFETSIEFASIESPDVRLRADEFAHFVTALLGFVATTDGVRRHLFSPQRKQPRDASLTAILDKAATTIDQAPVKPEPVALAATAEKIAQLRASLQSLTANSTKDALPVSDCLIIQRLDELLSHLHDLLFPKTTLEKSKRLRIPTPRFAYYSDISGALIHALRAALATLAIEALWYFTAWPGGEDAVVMTVVIISLFAPRPNPFRASLSFLKGIIIGGAFAAFCKFFLLTNLEGFPMFMLAISIFLIPVGLAAAKPLTAPLGIASAIYFLALMDTENAMTYDLSAFFNSLLILAAGAAIGAFAFRLIFPENLTAKRKSYRKAILRDLEKLSANRHSYDTATWQSVMFDRIRRCQPESDSNDPLTAIGDDWTESALAAMHIGLHIFRLRKIASSHSKTIARDFAKPVSQSLSALANIATAPQQSLTAIRHSITQLEIAVANRDPESRHIALIALGEVSAIAESLETNIPFFNISR